MTSFQAFALSLTLHVALLFLFSHLNLEHSEELLPIEIEYKDLDSTRRKQMVEQVEVPLNKLLKVEKPEEEAPFMSEKTVRVKEQTRAQANAPATNRGGSQSQNETAQQREKLDGLGTPMPTTSPDIAMGLSSTDDALPEELRLGDFTALNTDAHLYYTFFARVKDQIRYRWISQIQNITSEYRRHEFKTMSQDTWLTQVEVVLDNKGNFIKGAIMKESGSPAFDKAAILAFKRGAPYPNPPQELIKEDGKIYLDYAFQVRWSPSWERRF